MRRNKRRGSKSETIHVLSLITYGNSSAFMYVLYLMLSVYVQYSEEGGLK